MVVLIRTAREIVESGMIRRHDVVHVERSVGFFSEPPHRIWRDPSALRAYLRDCSHAVFPGCGCSLPPVPSVRHRVPAMGERATLSNGAALYHDSDIPWEIEAAAREALEESPG